VEDTLNKQFCEILEELKIDNSNEESFEKVVLQIDEGLTYGHIRSCYKECFEESKVSN
jgi:hypothetical protein